MAAIGTEDWLAAEAKADRLVDTCVFDSKVKGNLGVASGNTAVACGIGSRGAYARRVRCYLRIATRPQPGSGLRSGEDGEFVIYRH